MFLKKMTFALLSIISVIGFVDVNASQDSYFEVAMIAGKPIFQGSIKSRARDEGCMNKCGELQFNGKTYSQERLCGDCEFKQFPSRFIACVFCRSPFHRITPAQLSSNDSHACNSAVKDILEQSLKVNKNWNHQQALSMGIHCYLEKIRNEVGRKYIPALGNSTTQHAAFGLNRVGLYKGAQRLKNGNIRHVWSKQLAIDPSDKKEVLNWDEAEKHAQFICEKYNVFGPETGEIITQPVNGEVISFEEVASK